MKKVIIPAMCVMVVNYSKVQTEFTGSCQQNRTEVSCEPGTATVKRRGLIYRTDSTIVHFVGNNVITYWISEEPQLNSDNK